MLFFFAKKKKKCTWLVTFCKHQLQSLTILPMVMRKKSKARAPKKNVDSRKKGYFTRATTTSSSCRQMSFFFGQSTKGIFGCTSESFVCKKDWVENASSYQPFPSFQWFEPLNVFLTFFFGKNMSNATASTTILTPIIKHYFCSCCKHENLSF